MIYIPDYRRPEDLNRIESEAGILATLVYHPDYALHSEFLLPEHFTTVQNKVLYNALVGISRSEINTVDTYNIQEQIKHSDPANIDVLSKETIDEFITMSEVLARGSIKEYKILVSNVYDVAFRREMLRKLDECRSDLLNIDEEDIKKKIYAKVDSVMTSYSYGDEVEIYTEKVDSLWNEIQSRRYMCTR